MAKYNAGEYYKSLLDFSSFFNNSDLSDLVVYSSNDASATKIFCHKFVIKCASINLYEALMQNKIESKADVDHVVVVKELQDKDESLMKLFFNIMYNTAIVEKHDDKKQLDELSVIFNNYNMSDFSRASSSRSRLNISPFGNGIEKFLPKLNGATDLSDFTIYLDQAKQSYFKVHRIVLQKASTYYSGLFNSGMKESNSRESVISLDADINQEEMCQLTAKLLELVYSKSPIVSETFENMTPDILFGVSALTTKYLFFGIKPQFAAFIEATKEYPEYILPAIKYNDTNAMIVATEALLPQIYEINFNMIPVDFLQNLRVGDGGTIFHAILSNTKQGTLSPLQQIQTLQKLFGENSAITLKTKDDNGNNCLHLICQKSPTLFSEVVDLMIAQKMVDLNDLNKNGESALMLALRTLYNNEPSRSRTRLESTLNVEKMRKNAKANVTPVPLSVVDKLITAGAKVDFSRDEELKLFLAHVCHYENGKSDDVWRLIEVLLESVSKERVSKCLNRRDILVSLANAFTRPIEYFFGKLKIEISIDVNQSSTTKKEALVQVKTIDLNKIEIREKTYEIAKMKVHCKTEITNPYHRWEAFDGFDVDIGIHHLHFDANEEAFTLIAGLVCHVAGPKQLSETKTNKAPIKFWK